jgi:hypothetical protein
MKITGIEKPLKLCTQWSGTASNGDANYQWYYTPGSRFSMLKQEPGMPRVWMQVDPPSGARRTVVRAIRATKAC